MRKGIFMKMAAAGLALMMLIALAPSMGLATAYSPYIIINTYFPNAPVNQEPKNDFTMMGYYVIRNNPFTNPGYTFNGWNTQPNGSGTQYLPGTMISLYTPLMLYAQWKPVQNTVTITYKANGGTGQDVIDTVNKGASYSIRNCHFIREGYLFTGWNTQANGSGNTFKPGQVVVTPNNNQTLYAQWVKSMPAFITVTYKANAGDGQPDVIDSFLMETSYTIRGNPYFRPGHTFTGWNSQANGSGSTFIPGQLVKPSKSQILYAQWKAEPVHVTITLKANAGDNRPDIINTYMKGSNALLSNPAPRPGYTFIGWCTRPDGNGVIIKPGQPIFLNEDMVLYAIWIEDHVITDEPTAVDGRILPPSLTGDSSEWIEIARNGKYSLIVRMFAVNSVTFGASNVYAASNVRKACNDFFNAAVANQYVILPPSANLRNYTVQSNALSKMGFIGISDGFSKPTTNFAGRGDDVCFALNFCEAANLLSTNWHMNAIASGTVNSGTVFNPIVQSSANAVSNFRKLHQSNQIIWLRNPGNLINYAAAALTSGSYFPWGTAHQEPITFMGLVHPAVWVHSSIFDNR